MPDPEDLWDEDAALPIEAAPEPEPTELDRRPNRLLESFRNLWMKLTTPTTKKPQDYRDSRLARIVNDALDGANEEGAAHRAQLGEAVSLVADHAIAERGGAQTPLGHLMGATGEFAYRRWDEMQAAAEAPAPAPDRAPAK